LKQHLAGPESGYTGYNLFNSPDAAADCLKQAGFDLVVTANNHCLDRGYAGGVRTLRVLKQAGLDTLGTYASEDASREFLIKNIRGVKIGYLAYTYGTKRHTGTIPAPLLRLLFGQGKIVKDINTLRPQVVYYIGSAMGCGNTSPVPIRNS
jgi:poly-gamma-glutamate synthesis protein (capsule biosynthesis protein)